MHTLGEVPGPGGCLVPGVGVSSGGCLVPGAVVSGPGGWVSTQGVPGPGGVSGPGGWCPSMHSGRPPPVNRMTDRCKNITFANFVCGR